MKPRTCTKVRILSMFGRYYAELTPKPVRASPRVADAATREEVIAAVRRHPLVGRLEIVDASATASDTYDR